ncbi:MAG: MFS transporter [Ferruginibacter sp.]
MATGQELSHREKSFKKLPRFLTENAVLRYLSFSALYVAQGVPEGITFFAIPAWMAMNGKTPLEIGSFLGVIGIPWSFKIIVAPLMDRFTILSMGRKRPWVIFGQLGLIVSFLSIAFVHDPLNNLSGLMIAGFFISFFGAFQDVATDGMAIDVVPEQQQARANGLMWGSKTIGTSISLVTGTALINTIGFTTAVSSLSIVVACIVLIPLLIRERPGEKLLPWTKGEPAAESKLSQLSSWKNIFMSLVKVVPLKSSVIMIAAVFFIGLMFGLVDTMLPIFTIQELGWTNTDFSHVYSVTTLIGGFLGMFAGGVLVDYFGKIRMMSLYLLFLVISICLFAFFPGLWKSVVVIYCFVLMYYVLYTFLCIAMFAAAMNLCWKTVAATQFTLYMAVSNMGRAAGSALLGYIKQYADWSNVFLFIALMPFVALIVIQFINFIKHLEKIKQFQEYHIETKALLVTEDNI